MSESIASTYEVLGKIGSGGGGNVFLAYHKRLGKKVVLKADKRTITTRADLLRREVDVLKELNHTYIPQVYDFFVENETVYTVMDYIEGESLDRPLKRGEHFQQPQVIKWAVQLLEALCYLHSPTHGDPPRGFVHSDIKPANIMRTANDDICLIDFNIALALGEDSIVGCSAGYASPEHYGLDFSTEAETASIRQTKKQEDGDKTETFVDDDRTVTDVGQASSSGISNASSSTPRKRLIVPDIRSDIYSTGATLYHLLKGERPSRNAKEVVPLSEKEFSPPLVQIITKAMNPNPDLRYQTADEMLYDLLNLREHDPRVKRFKRIRRFTAAVLSVIFAAGAGTAFTGLKRMQTEESWLKLAEYSKNALQNGEKEDAVRYALEALPKERTFLMPEYTAEAQSALAEALGIYDLSDDFKLHGSYELPSAPLLMKLSPDGKTAACLYAFSVSIWDTETMDRIAVLPTVESALAEVEYLDDQTIVYAGMDGLTVYDLEKEKEIWRGEPATAIAVSGDKKMIAAVYKDDASALVYDAEDGNIKKTVDFHGKYQSVTVNDSFANPNDNLFALDFDAGWLGASFADGSLRLFNLKEDDADIELFDDTSGFFHFEGGFYQEFFAFSATNEESSVFSVIDTLNICQTGGFESESPFRAETDENGIYVQTENLLVKIDPETGDQTPLVTTSELIEQYAFDSVHTMILTESGIQFFDRNAVLVSAQENAYAGKQIQIADGTALISSLDSPKIQVLRYESHPEAEIFSYDPSYEHDEARLSADGKTVMLFRYDGFRLYSIDGELIQETKIPDAKQVYDQQYVREKGESSLRVIYNDGTVVTYSAVDGTKQKEEKGEAKDKSLFEEFVTDSYRIESPLHGSPTVYDRESGKEICHLKEDSYLTYVTQVGDRLVVQYMNADGQVFGELLNKNCEVIAELPYLCDVIGERLLFDYPTGNLRETRIYNRNELIDTAQQKKGE